MIFNLNNLFHDKTGLTDIELWIYYLDWAMLPVLMVSKWFIINKVINAILILLDTVYGQP